MIATPAWFRYIVTAMTIVGGLHGICLMFLLIFDANVEGLGNLVLLLCMLAVFVYVTVAGLLFWKRPNEIRLLWWALAIQVPWISLPGFVYKLGVGFVGVVEFVINDTGSATSAGFGTNWDLGSTFTVRFLQKAPVEVGVNATALAALLLLRRYVAGRLREASPVISSEDGSARLE
jgi:hypothetical protein